MPQKTIEEVAQTIAKKLGWLNRKKNQRILNQYLKPCIAGQKANVVTTSKIGGSPLLPADFTIPTFEGQKLQFFCQINFAELESWNSNNIFPKHGLLVMFMYLKDSQGNFTIPNFNQAHLASFYFEDIESLSIANDDSINCKQFIETPLQFQDYMDFPESGDAHINAEDAKIDKDGIISWELLPEVFGMKEDPSFKLLGYPTSDALNTYSEWYFFDQGINLMTPGDKSDLYEQASAEANHYTLFMQIDLEGLAALKLDDQFAEFGSMSIGIHKAALKEKDFSKLLFKYAMS